MEEKENLSFGHTVRMARPGDDDYEKKLKEREREARIRAECAKIAPELAHYLWPDRLELEGPWDEPEPDHPNFFQKTLYLISGEFQPWFAGRRWKLPFERLNWEDGKASLTGITTYWVIDEHKLRLYGFEEEVECKKEHGVWLEREGDEVSFKVIRHAGGRNFDEFSGRISPGRLSLSIDSPREKEDKLLLKAYFNKVGLRVTNLPE